MRSDEVAPETWAIVGGRPHDHPGAPLNVPMMPASNFIHGTERIYSRNEATEGWEAFEAVVGGLEGGDAVAFASGMGACAAVLGQLPQGARLVLGDDCYQGVAELAETGARDRGWQVERLPVADERWVERAGEADMLWVESPSNPLLEIADIAAICAAPRGDGTKVVVDNTFATPLRQRPLDMGADVAVHSATKFMGGHADLLLGVAVTRSPEQLQQHANRSLRRRCHAGNARVLSCASRDPHVAASPPSGVGQRGRPGGAARHALGCRAGPLPRLRRHRQLRAGPQRRRRPGLRKHADHPSRDQPRWRRDHDGAPQCPSRPGAHPRRLDPDERRLRGRRRPLGRSAVGAYDLGLATMSFRALAGL